QELQLRFLCIRVVVCCIDLRGCKVAARSQFRCIQLHEHLSFVQTIAFPRKNFLYASTHARADVRFVHFDRSRDRVLSSVARAKKDRHCERGESPKRLISDERFSHQSHWSSQRFDQPTVRPRRVSAPSRIILRIPANPSFGVMPNSSIFNGFMIAWTKASRISIVSLAGTSLRTIPAR